jgi:uncharacterized iron-regulated protein
VVLFQFRAPQKTFDRSEKPAYHTVNIYLSLFGLWPDLDTFGCMKKGLFLLLLPLSVFAYAKDFPVYRIFNSKGKPVSLDQMVGKLAKNQVVLFGEYHDDPIMHWLQLLVTQKLYARFGSQLTLGAEMFEFDMQEPLDRYLRGDTDEKTFKSEVTSLWPNYATDYKPLVEFAKEKKLNFVATNIPRYLARAVYKGGFEILDTVNAELRKSIPPSPIPYDPELPGYKNMLSMGHGGENLPKAQAIKDAVMAFHIARWAGKGIFLHFNGTYHSDGYEGIGWYLKQYAPALRVTTIAAVRSANPTKLASEEKGKADFIVSVHEQITRTH